MRGEDTAIAGNESNVVFWHLAPPSITPHLHDCLRHRGHPPHIERAELTAAGVHGKRAARADCSARDEWAALALLAKPVIPERDQHRECIAVIEPAEVHVTELDSRHLEGGFPGDRCA